MVGEPRAECPGCISSTRLGVVSTKKKLVISLDFGTTFSGIGYVYPNNPGKVITAAPGARNRRNRPRLPRTSPRWVKISKRNTVQTFPRPTAFKTSWSVRKLLVRSASKDVSGAAGFGLGFALGGVIIITAVCFGLGAWFGDVVRPVGGR